MTWHDSYSAVRLNHHIGGCAARKVCRAPRRVRLRMRRVRAAAVIRRMETGLTTSRKLFLQTLDVCDEFQNARPDDRIIVDL